MAEDEITGAAAPEDEGDPFEGAVPIEGLEQFGRAIVDAAGAPSGSPANYEHLRGLAYPPGAEPEAAWTAASDLIAQAREALLAEQAPPPPAPEA